MTENNIVLKQVVKVAELLDQLTQEVARIQKRVKKIENPEFSGIPTPNVKDLFNMKRGEPFNEGTD